MFQPPENELQKGLGGERVLSEHQLRVQRSLQKLNVPDWYKNSTVARDGFSLHKPTIGSRDHQGWPGLSSKTTSLSSLGHNNTSVRSPTSGGEFFKNFILNVKPDRYSQITVFFYPET